MVRVGINGLGRIGRIVVRCSVDNPNIEIVAINVPSITAEYAAYTLKFDSTHGRFNGTIEHEGDNLLIINGHRITLFDEREPAKIPWYQEQADYIVESTGKFTTVESASQHFVGGAKRVVISSPSKDAPMFVVGVNLDKCLPEYKVISNASCTTNCLAPLVKVINDEFGIVEGIMITVHSLTNSQNIIDGHSKRDWRDGRSGNCNVIPTTTGAAKAIGKIIPELSGKLNGMSLRVPTSNVSVVDLTVRLENPTNLEEICKAIKMHAKGSLYGILGYNDDHLVSQDFLGSPYSCNFDAKASIMLNSNFVKLIAWYDNEWGYSARILELVEYLYKLDCK